MEAPRTWCHLIYAHARCAMLYYALMTETQGISKRHPLSPPIPCENAIGITNNKGPLIQTCMQAVQAH